MLFYQHSVVKLHIVVQAEILAMMKGLLANETSV